jgi:hypothetical protein
MRRLPFTKDLAPEHERGQSLVELALVFVLLLWLVSIILDLGRAYYVIVALENAAEEGAAYASIDPSCLQERYEDPGCNDPNNAIWRAKHENPGGLLSPELIDITFSFTTPLAPGEPIIVNASYPYKVMTPLGGTILGTDTITLTGSAMRIVMMPGGEGVPAPVTPTNTPTPSDTPTPSNTPEPCAVHYPTEEEGYYLLEGFESVRVYGHPGDVVYVYDQSDPLSEEPVLLAGPVLLESESGDWCSAIKDIPLDLEMVNSVPLVVGHSIAVIGTWGNDEDVVYGEPPPPTDTPTPTNTPTSTATSTPTQVIRDYPYFDVLSVECQGTKKVYLTLKGYNWPTGVKKDQLYVYWHNGSKWLRVGRLRRVDSTWVLRVKLKVKNINGTFQVRAETKKSDAEYSENVGIYCVATPVPTSDLPPDDDTSPTNTPTSTNVPVVLYSRYVDAGAGARCDDLLAGGYDWEVSHAWSGSGWGHFGDRLSALDYLTYNGVVVDTDGDALDEDEQALFKCRIVGDKGTDIGYHFDLPNASYEVILLFSENKSDPGERFFDIYIEGVLVVNDFDIAATAQSLYEGPNVSPYNKGRLVAIDLTFSNVSISDGRLTVLLVGNQPGAKVSDPMLMGISIEEQLP